jgi:hypothetical protein
MGVTEKLDFFDSQQENALLGCFGSSTPPEILPSEKL